MNPPAKYLYVVNLIENQLLSGHWLAGQKIPSIRYLALEWQIHINTVMRACRDLQQQGLICSKKRNGTICCTWGYLFFAGGYISISSRQSP